MGITSKNFTTTSFLFIFAAISFVVDLFFGVAFMAGDTPCVKAFFDAVGDSFLFPVIMAPCCLWWIAQIFIEPLLLLNSCSEYSSLGSKKSKLQLALAQLAIAITWVMCFCVMIHQGAQM